MFGFYSLVQGYARRTVQCVVTRVLCSGAEGGTRGAPQGTRWKAGQCTTRQPFAQYPGLTSVRSPQRKRMGWQQTELLPLYVQNTRFLRLAIVDSN